MKALLRNVLAIVLLGAASSLLLVAQGLPARGAAARQKAARPLTSIELLLKLYHGSPAAAAAAIKVRGTGFDMTAPLEKLLVEAGADKSLLALAALRRVDVEAAAVVPAASAAGNLLRLDEAVQARKLIQRPEVNRPAGSGAAGGNVKVELHIGADGRVKNARVLSGGGDQALAAAALEAARGSVYRPTVLDGQAVEVATEVTIGFEPAASDKTGNQD